MVRSHQFIFLLLGALLVTGCHLKLQSPEEKEKDTTKGVTTGSDITGTTAVANFRLLINLYATATEVSPSTFSVRNYIALIQSRLSVDGSATTVSSSQLTATIGLAGEFCHRFIELQLFFDVADRKILKTVTTSDRPSLMTPTNIVTFGHQFAEIYWARQLNEEEQLIAIEFIEKMSESSPNTFTELKRLLKLECTLIAASFETFNL